MGKNGNYTETHKTKSGKLDNQTKVALLEYLTESDEFHKAEYLDVCDRYKQEQERSNNLLHKWKEETAKRMKAQADLGDSHSHHNNVMNRIKDLLKEVDMPSVKKRN